RTAKISGRDRLAVAIIRTFLERRPVLARMCQFDLRRFAGLPRPDFAPFYLQAPAPELWMLRVGQRSDHTLDQPGLILAHPARRFSMLHPAGNARHKASHLAPTDAYLRDFARSLYRHVHEVAMGGLILCYALDRTRRD